jgi:hypothetical protein
MLALSADAEKSDAMEPNLVASANGINILRPAAMRSLRSE